MANGPHSPALGLAPNFTAAGFPTSEYLEELTEMAQTVLDCAAARALLAAAQAKLVVALQAQGLTAATWAPTRSAGSENEVRLTALVVRDALTRQDAKVTLQLIGDTSPRGRTELWLLVDAVSGDSRCQTEQLMACEWAADVQTHDRQFEMRAALVAHREKLEACDKVAAWLSQVHMP